MKTLLVLSLTLILALPAIAMAQDPASQSPSGSSASQPSASPSQSPSQSNDTMGQSAKSGAVKGTVSQDGKTLVSDDGKSWTIANPDAVKGHEGQRVELKGSADASTNQINVTSVKASKGDKGAKKDNMQQPQ